jgi:hypothetical protein
MGDSAVGDTVGYQDFVSVGLSVRQVDWWTIHGFLTAVVPRPGSGVTRLWPVGELAVARVMLRCVRAGVTPEAACRAARNDGWLAAGVRLVITDEVVESE